MKEVFLAEVGGSKIAPACESSEPLLTPYPTRDPDPPNPGASRKLASSILAKNPEALGKPKSSRFYPAAFFADRPFRIRNANPKIGGQESVPDTQSPPQ